MSQSEEWGYEAKFSVRTDFLDTTFRRNRQQREGESYEDYCVEMHREMLGVIERLRREFGSSSGEWRYSEPHGTTQTLITPKDGSKPYYLSSPMPIIDKDVEKLEILIDNAQTIADLAQFKEEASKHNLVSLYMSKLKSLINE